MQSSLLVPRVLHILAPCLVQGVGDWVSQQTLIKGRDRGIRWRMNGINGMDRYMGVEKDGWMGTWVYRWMDGWVSRQSDRQTER